MISKEGPFYVNLQVPARGYNVFIMQPPHGQAQIFSLALRTRKAQYVFYF